MSTPMNRHVHSRLEDAATLAAGRLSRLRVLRDRVTALLVRLTLTEARAAVQRRALEAIAALPAVQADEVTALRVEAALAGDAGEWVLYALEAERLDRAADSAALARVEDEIDVALARRGLNLDVYVSGAFTIAAVRHRNGEAVAREHDLNRTVAVVRAYLAATPVVGGVL